jgi:hypothetical protein
MNFQPRNALRQDLAIDALTRQTELPRDTVAKLYADELSALDRRARIKQFLPVFAARRVLQRARAERNRERRRA